MTNEQAIKELQESHDIMRNHDIDESESYLMQALNMAIKALQAQADREKTCGTCRNEDTYHCAECENKSDYEQSQADGEYILKSEAIRVASGYCHPSNIAKELEKLPSVAIPSAEPYKGMTKGEIMHKLFPNDCFVVGEYGFDEKWWNSPYEPQESESDVQ